ncbi:MAG: hypothetical protein WED04_10385 [Promethearchaeati archaeon SRVP18_Atabeyarchaeia-1]
MPRCPNCGNWIAVRARRYEDFSCSRCHATLRCSASGGAAPFALAILFCGLFVFIAINASLLFLWLLFPSFFAILGSSRKLEIVRRPTPTSPEETARRGLQARPTRADQRQSRVDALTSMPQERGALGYCKYCGATVGKSDWRFCRNCGASLIELDSGSPTGRSSISAREVHPGQCMVCGFSLLDTDQIAHCPHCGSAAHRVHLLEWIHVRGKCPVCSRHLNEQEIG